MHPINETLLDEKLAQLERASNWSPRVISKLEAFIRTADDFSSFRINPVQYATERGMAENEAIDLFLHAAKIGLFDLEWNLLCGCCGQIFSSLRSIGKLQTHFVCSICRMVNDLEFDDLIQVSFTVAGCIRDNVYRHPENLSAEEYVFRYLVSKGISREPGLGANADYIHKYVRTLSYLGAGETLTVDVDITPGLVYGGDLLHNSVFTFVAAPVENAAPPPVHVSFRMPTMQLEQPEAGPVVITIPTAHGDMSFDFAHFAQVPTGRSSWTFENRTSERACIWALDAPEDITSTWMVFQSFLSGKRLLSSQTFRNLYRSEVLDANEGIGIRDITFLFTDLKGSTALYDQLGDLRAYHLVRQHFDALGSVVVKHSGAIVKTIGDAVMASFTSAKDGLQAALEIFRAIDEFNNGRTEKIILKIGLHTGHSIAVTLNDRLDYFGQTVNIASRIQQLAEANEIYLSQDVYACPGVCGLLDDCHVTPLQTSVKGVSGQLQLYKISLEPME